jgi:hypothetical protein
MTEFDAKARYEDLGILTQWERIPENQRHAIHAVTGT